MTPSRKTTEITEIEMLFIYISSKKLIINEIRLNKYSALKMQNLEKGKNRCHFFLYKASKNMHERLFPIFPLYFLHK